MFPSPLPLAEVTSNGLKGLAFFSLILLLPLFFCFWELHVKDEGIQKQLLIRDRLESHHKCPGKGVGLEKTSEDLKITPQDDPELKIAFEG